MSTELVLPPQELVDRINGEHDACESDFRKSLEHAINCGNLLREVRLRLPSGSWGAWVAENFKGPDRTARAYMQVAAAYHQNPELVAETTGSLRSAIAFISRQTGNGDIAADDHDEDADVVDSDAVEIPERVQVSLSQLAELVETAKAWLWLDSRSLDALLTTWLVEKGIG